MALVRVKGADGKFYDVPAVPVDDAAVKNYNDGYKIGLEAGREECKAKHFVGEVIGDGSQTLLIEGLDFDPDTISVICFHGVHGEDGTKYANNVVQSFVQDNRAIEGVDTLSCAISLSYYGSNQTSQSMRQYYAGTGTGGNRVFRNEDGVYCVTKADVFAGGWQYGVFGEGLKYLVMAEKHT